MATAINFIKQLERRRREGFGSDIQVEEEGGGIGTKLRRLSLLQGDDALSVGDALLMLLVAAMLFGYVNREVLLDNFVRQSKVAEIDSQISSLDNDLAAQAAKLNQFSGIKSEIEAYEQQARAFTEKIEVIKSVRYGRNSAVRMIDQVVQALPANVWMTKVSLDIQGSSEKSDASPKTDVADKSKSDAGVSLGTLRLEGYAKNFQDVSAFLKELDKIYFFKDMKLEQSESETSKGPSASLLPETKKFIISAVVARII